MIVQKHFLKKSVYGNDVYSVMTILSYIKDAQNCIPLDHMMLTPPIVMPIEEYSFVLFLVLHGRATFPNLLPVHTRYFGTCCCPSCKQSKEFFVSQEARTIHRITQHSFFVKYLCTSWLSDGMKEKIRLHLTYKEDYKFHVPLLVH